MKLTSLRTAAAALFLAIALPIPGALASDYANPQLLSSADGLESRNGAENLRIIDVRKTEDFRQGHIPGALSLPFTELTDPHAAVAGALKSDASLAALFGEIGIDQKSEIVLYDDQGGFRAARLFWILEYYGHRNVSILNGGIQAWVASGRSLERPEKSSKTASRFEPTVFAITRSPRRFASADTILQHRGDDSTVVIDVRPAKMYHAGHIPWAKSIPWKQNLTDDSMLKSADELLAHFAAQGVEPGHHVIIHCQTGEASAHSYFAMRLVGFPRVRTYHRSWAEWGRDPALPQASS